MVNWYTADTHFGHERIIELCNRPFKSASHMDGVLIENMWKVVQPEDSLWIVGDFAHGQATENTDWLEHIFSQLPGAYKHLIIGNHDGELTQSLPWDSVSHLAEVPDANGGGDTTNVLCHYPMLTWNGARKGALHLFGHVHNQWQGARNAVNVGVDMWDFTPVTLPDIARRAAKLPLNKHWKDVEH